MEESAAVHHCPSSWINREVRMLVLEIERDVLFSDKYLGHQGQCRWLE